MEKIRLGPYGLLSIGEIIDLTVNTTIDEMVIIFIFNQGKWRIIPGGRNITLENTEPHIVAYFVLIITKWSFLVPTPITLAKQLFNKLRKKKVTNGYNHE